MTAPRSQKPSRRIVFLSLFFTVIVLMVPAFYLLRSGGPPPSARIAGRVLDEKGQPVRGAQVVVTGADSSNPQVTYVDDQGIFFVTVPSSGRTARVEVNAVGHETFEREVGLQGGSQIEQIRLSSSPELVHSDQTPRQQQDDSGVVPSGSGANWSNWYRVCSTAAPDGFRVSSSSFHLEGDRRCNAWSECQEESNTEKQVCWRFRLQGHSESVFQNEGRALSRGILQTILEPIPHGGLHSDQYGVVYIQFSGEQNRAIAEELRQELVKNGYRVPGVQRLDFLYPNVVKYFNDADATSASTLATVVTAFLDAGRYSIPPVRPVRASNDVSVPAGQMEVWLNFQSLRR